MIYSTSKEALFKGSLGNWPKYASLVPSQIKPTGNTQRKGNLRLGIDFIKNQLFFHFLRVAGNGLEYSGEMGFTYKPRFLDENQKSLKEP